MPAMLLCHCIFAIFAFSGSTFFDSAYLADALSSDVDVRVEVDKHDKQDHSNRER